MATPEEIEFRQSRMGGIGGSDIGSLLAHHFEVEYGCERHLWARLSGIPTDNPEDDGSEPMRLGNILEPYVALAYSDLTGRTVEIVGLKKHPTEESLQVHADRLIYPAPGDERQTKGVLEIKAVGREMMRKIQEQGLPVDYLLQLNHGMLCHDLEWGAFAVATREDMLPIAAIDMHARMRSRDAFQPALFRRAKILHFDIPRSPEICKAIEEYGPKFWATIGKEAEAPARLEPEDPRCGRCPRRIWCQGAALMQGIEPEAHIPRRPDLAPLVDEYKANVALLEQCEDLVKETEQKFKTALDKTTAVKVPVQTEKGTEWKNVIYRLRQGSERMDGRGMALSYDLLRRTAIAAGVSGAELTQPSSGYARRGMPSRPLLLSAIVPKKTRGKGEVPEQDEE